MDRGITKTYKMLTGITGLRKVKQTFYGSESSVPLFRRRCSKDSETGVLRNRNLHISKLNISVVDHFLKSKDELIWNDVLKQKATIPSGLVTIA